MEGSGLIPEKCAANGYTLSPDIQMSRRQEPISMWPNEMI